MTTKLIMVNDDEDICVTCGNTHPLNNMYVLLKDKKADIAYNICKHCHDLLQSRNTRNISLVAAYLINNQETRTNILRLLTTRFPLLRKVMKKIKKKLGRQP